QPRRRGETCRGFARQLRHIHLLPLDRRQGSTAPRYVEQVLDQPAEPPAARGGALEALTSLFLREPARLDRLDEAVDVELRGHQRRLQLMRRRGDELLADRERGPQLLGAFPHALLQ